MLSRKITYLALMIISVFFYIFFIEKLSFYIMVFVFALPVVLFLITLIGKFSLSYSLNPISNTVLKKENCKFELNIKNKSIFPFPTVVVNIEYKNKLSETMEDFYISIPIHPRTNQTLTFNLTSDYCGILHARIKKIKIYDYIKLWSLNVNKASSADVYIIPDINISAAATKFKMTAQDEGNEFSKIKSGDDPSEIFELKEYIPGDKINRIHWNLSSKQNQLITKHYSLPTDFPIAVISDLTMISGDTDIYEANAMLELFYGISFLLLENGINHQIYISNNSDGINISDYEELNNIYMDILKNNFSSNENSIFQNVINSKSKIYFVTNKDYKNFQIPTIPDNAELKCFFVGNFDDAIYIKNYDNIKICLMDSVSYQNVPDDILI